MHLPILGLFDTTLKQDSRNKLLAWLRSGLVWVLMLALMGALQFQGVIGVQAGYTFFTSLVWINLWVILVGGLGYFAGLVSDEKQEDNLALLRLTGLSPVSVMLGTVGSRLVSALLLLAIQAPFLLLAVNLGGLSQEQVLAGLICLGGTLVLVAMLGLFTSVVARTPLQSLGLAAVLMGLMVCLPGLCNAISGVSGRPDPAHSALPFWPLLAYVGAWAWDASPMLRLSQICQADFGPVSPLFGRFTGMVLFLSLGLFLVSWLLFDRFAQHRRQVEDVGFWATLLRRHERQARRIRGNPIVWREFHVVLGGWPRLVLLVLLYGLAVVGVSLVFPPGWQGLRVNELGLHLLVIGLIGTGVHGILMAANILNREWRERTLGALLVLPITVSDLLWQKMLASLVHLLPGLVLVLAGGLLALLPFWEMSATRHDLRDLTTVLTVAFPACSVYLCFLLLVMFQSLRHQRAAIPRAVLILVIYAIPFSLAIAMIAAITANLMEGSLAAFVALLIPLPFIRHLYRETLTRLSRVAGE